jgi:hypothetical protein
MLPMVIFMVCPKTFSHTLAQEHRGVLDCYRFKVQTES